MYFEHKELLLPPIARAAYSDRTAWLMAGMSRLAYLKFETDDQLLDQLADRLAKLDDRKAIREELVDFTSNGISSNGADREELDKSLSDASFKIVATFNNGGTQAFLVIRESDRMAVLAFRGTEKNFDDIKTDLNARFYVRDGVKVHDGFQRAFALVETTVRKAVADLPADYKLYITGHSLGGALALVATRALNSDNVAACYTFGSPRVGNIDFDAVIKVPIYRVVNAADVVPRVPPTWTLDLAIFVAGILPIPYVRSALIRFLQSFRGYRHHGDMRFLTPCREDSSDVRLIANPDLLDRVRWTIQRLTTDWEAGFKDHSIDIYCAKLENYALRRL